MTAALPAHERERLLALYYYPYREWVETYSSAEFEALARRLEVLLDRYGGSSSSTSNVPNPIRRC